MAGLAVMAAGFVSGAQAQQAAGEKWVLIGKGPIDATKQNGSIDLSKARGAYKSIRLINRRGEIDIVNVDIRHAAGGSSGERRPINLKAGERTRPIVLRSETFLEDVTLSLKSRPASAPAGLIEVYGLQTAAGAKMARPASGSRVVAGNTTSEHNTSKPGTVTQGGDVMFGFQSVGFAVDRDTVRVGAEIGKFDRIRLRVLENDIHLNE